MQTHLSVTSLSGDGSGGNTFTKGNLCPDFRQIRGGQRTLSASVDSQLPLAQKNPYAKVAYLGVAYPDPLHVERSRRS